MLLILTTYFSIMLLTGFPFLNNRCFGPPLHYRLRWKCSIGCTWSSSNFQFFWIFFCLWWTCFSFFISFLLYLYNTFSTLFLLFTFYVLFIATVLQNFTQLFTPKICFVISTSLWWNCFTHITPHTGHAIHKNGTVYLYSIKASAKLSVDNPQNCLMWQADSCLN